MEEAQEEEEEEDEAGLFHWLMIHWLSVIIIIINQWDNHSTSQDGPGWLTRRDVVKSCK